MFQNMCMTAITPMSYKTEISSWENQPFTAAWPEYTHHKEKDITKTIKKKPTRVRTAFTTEQLRTLEEVFSTHKYINPEYRRELAKDLKMTDRSVKIWFQNRRMKLKKIPPERSIRYSNEYVSSESISSGSPPPSASQPIQTNDYNKTENTNQYNFNNYSEYYQLPPSYANNEVSQNVNGAQPDNVSEWLNDCNVYSTHFYANYGDTNNASEERNALNNFYEWAINNNEYNYTPM